MMLLLTVLVGGISCQGKAPEYTTATPEGTVKLLFDAYSSLDPDKIVNLYIEETREEIRPATVGVLGQFQSIRIVDLEIETISQTEATAIVEASFTTIYVEKDGTPGRFPFHTVEFHLEKRGGEWLISQPPPVV